MLEMSPVTCKNISKFLIDTFGKDGKWLDAECNCGFTMDALIGEGVDVLGFDSCQYAIDNVSESVVGRVLCSDGLDKNLYQLEAFDLIYSFGTVEYIPTNDISLWLSNLHRWARPNSTLFMFVCFSEFDNIMSADKWHLNHGGYDISYLPVQTKKWWENQLYMSGFVPYSRMYNEDAPVLKENGLDVFVCNTFE